MTWEECGCAVNGMLTLDCSLTNIHSSRIDGFSLYTTRSLWISQIYSIQHHMTFGLSIEFNFIFVFQKENLCHDLNWIAVKKYLRWYLLRFLDIVGLDRNTIKIDGWDKSGCVVQIVSYPTEDQDKLRKCHINRSRPMEFGLVTLIFLTTASSSQLPLPLCSI